jgi:hypothetical protein
LPGVREKAVSALALCHTQSKTCGVLRRWFCLLMTNPRDAPPKRGPIVQGRKAAMECGFRCGPLGNVASPSLKAGLQMPSGLAEFRPNTEGTKDERLDGRCFGGAAESDEFERSGGRRTDRL